MSAPDWIVEDIERLVRMLADELQVNINNQEVDDIVAAATGLPRYVKMLFRHYRNGTSEGLPLPQLLLRVTGEQL